MPKFGVQKNNIPAPERNMLYSRFVRGNIIGTVVHYPEYEGSELAKGGFAGVTRILTDGDMRVSSKPKDSRAYTCIDETAPVINISHAESITLITYTDWTDDLGEYCEFRDRVNGKDTFALVDKCINKVNSVDITEEPVSLEHKNIELKLDGGYFASLLMKNCLTCRKMNMTLCLICWRNYIITVCMECRHAQERQHQDSAACGLVSGICCGEVRTQWMPMLIFRFRE